MESCHYMAAPQPKDCEQTSTAITNTRASAPTTRRQTLQTFLLSTVLVCVVLCIVPATFDQIQSNELGELLLQQQQAQYTENSANAESRIHVANKFQMMLGQSTVGRAHNNPHPPLAGSTHLSTPSTKTQNTAFNKPQRTNALAQIFHVLRAQARLANSNDNDKSKDSAEAVFSRGVALGSETVSVTHLYGSVPMHLPKAFECDGIVFESAKPLENQGQDSCTLFYTTSLLPLLAFSSQHQTTPDQITDITATTQSIVVVAKFALSLTNDNNKGNSEQSNHEQQQQEDQFQARSASSRDMLINEVAMLQILHDAKVPNIVPLVAACELDTGLRVMVIGKASGHVIAASEGHMLALNQQPTTKGVHDIEILEMEREMIRETFETAFATVRAGILNNDQANNIVLDDSTGHVTFIDFGIASRIDHLSKKQLASMVPMYFKQFFEMVPERHEEMMRPLLSNLIANNPIPHLLSESMILDLWENRSSTANVLGHWREFFGVKLEVVTLHDW